MGELERVVPLRTGSHGLDRVEARHEDGGTWLSLHETRERLGIPLSSLRRYLDRHGRYIPSVKSGKRVLIARSALPILERIRKLYDAGRTVAAVEDELGLAALLGAREELAGTAVEAAGGSRVSHYLSPPPNAKARPASVTTGPNPPPADTAGPPPAEIQRQVAVLERKLSEMQASLEDRDVMIRQILSAIVHVIEAHDNERRFAENERQIADDERDRQSSHRHQQLMLSLQEILNFTRRRRWLW